MINYFWPTPIYENWADEISFSVLESEFLEILEEKKNSFSDPWKDNRIQVSDNFKTNLFHQYELENFKLFLDVNVRNFLSLLGEDVKDYLITDCWLTKSTINSYGHIHNHMPADISGVFYIKTNEEDGNIFFENPLQISYSSSLGNKNLFHPSYSVSPKKGKILLFPGWVNHGINTNKTNSERISVSFNISISTR